MTQQECQLLIQTERGGALSGTRSRTVRVSLSRASERASAPDAERARPVSLLRLLASQFIVCTTPPPECNSLKTKQAQDLLQIPTHTSPGISNLVFCSDLFLFLLFYFNNNTNRPVIFDSIRTRLNILFFQNPLVFSYVDSMARRRDRPQKDGENTVELKFIAFLTRNV